MGQLDQTVSRRLFLQTTAGASGIWLTSFPAEGADFNHELPTYRFRARRDADLLNLEFTFVNFRRHGDRLLALGAGQSLVIIGFPPQNLAEARFDKQLSDQPNEDPKFPTAPTPTNFEEPIIPIKATGGGPRYSPVPPIPAYLSGPSWVVFEADDRAMIPLSEKAAAELGWHCGGHRYQQGTVIDRWLQVISNWPIRVPQNAVEPGTPTPPSNTETCLEVPFRLLISPASRSAKWLTSSSATFGFDGPGSGAVELWHAALHDREKVKSAELPPDIVNLPPELAPANPNRVTVQARAVYSPDYQANGQPPWSQFYPGDLGLSHRAVVRHALVHQMQIDKDGWIDAEHLVLSALGASANLSYTMQRTFRQIHDRQLAEISASEEEPSKIIVAIWKHRMVVGRDVFLLNVTPGFLMPFVFPTLYVELTRRTFAAYGPRGNGPMDQDFSAPGAYLLTEYFLLVQDPVRHYGEATDVLTRKMPIKRASLLQTRSPLIYNDSPEHPFVPRQLSDGEFLRWSMEFEDGSGNRSRSDDVKLVFASHVVQGHNDWEARTGRNDPITSWAMGGQKVALAPSHAELRFNPAGIGAPDQSKIIAHRFEENERAVLGIFAKELREANDVLAQARRRLGNAGDALANQLTAATRARLTDAANSIAPQLARLRAALPGELLHAANIAKEIPGIIDSLPNQLQAGTITADEVLDTLNPLLEKEAVRAKADAIREVITVVKRVTGSELPGALSNAANTAKEILRIIKDLPDRLQAGSITAEQVLDSLNQSLDQVADLAKADVSRGVFTVVERVTDFEQAMTDDLLRQMSRAEQAATDAEVHAMRFASRRVDKLFQLITTQVNTLLDQATGLEDFIVRLQNLPGNLKLGDSELDRLQSELKARINTVTAEWGAQRQELKEFFNELRTSALTANGFLRHGFQPQLKSADVIVPALKAMGGTVGAQTLELIDDYTAKGFAKVENGVFAAFQGPIDEGKKLAKQATNAVASPAAVVAGLSRDLGAVVGQTKADIESLSKPLPADSSDVVTEIVRKAIPDTKLLGVLSMQQLVRRALTAADVPTIQLKELPNRLEQTWEWNTRIKDNLELPPFLRFLIAPPPVKGGVGVGRKEPVHLYLRMITRTEIPRPTTQSLQSGDIPKPTGRVELVGHLAFWDVARKSPIIDSERDSFAIELLSLIQVRFRRLSFESEYDVGSSPKPKLIPKLGTVEFLPPLDFVAKLQESLPFLGEGFRIEQDPGRIGVSYQFVMPAIAFGAFSLRNLSIGSSCLFSLEGEPVRFRFNFATFAQPFELTVMAFGGRGFLQIAADTGGYRDLQGALEFGGSLAFDVGVASGGLYVMAGIYFRVTTTFTDVSGFIRAGGCVNVLGLIHASVEFLLMMKYIKEGENSLLFGIATVTVSIDLFLISQDVSFSLEKRIAGGGGNSSRSASRLTDEGLTRLASWSRSDRQVASPEIPVAYFESRTHAGRFAPDTWYRDYWNQFGD